MEYYFGGEMITIFKHIKIKKELKRFKEFKSCYNFEKKTIVEKKGYLFCDEICLGESDNLQLIGESEKFVNVSYKAHGSLPKILSNLFPYSFYFKGYKLHSIESFFQGIKFKNKKSQKLVFKLSGLDSNNIKAAQDYIWQEERVVYFMGKPYKRDSKEYEDLVDELYVSLLQNPLYVNALKSVGNKYILHIIGAPNTKESVFSRCEFEKQLNCLKDYCLMYK